MQRSYIIYLLFRTVDELKGTLAGTSSIVQHIFAKPDAHISDIIKVVVPVAATGLFCLYARAKLTSYDHQLGDPDKSLPIDPWAPRPLKKPYVSNGAWQRLLERLGLVEPRYIRVKSYFEEWDASLPIRRWVYPQLDWHDGNWHGQLDQYASEKSIELLVRFIQKHVTPNKDLRCKLASAHQNWHTLSVRIFPNDPVYATWRDVARLDPVRGSIWLELHPMDEQRAFFSGWIPPGGADGPARKTLLYCREKGEVRLFPPHMSLVFAPLDEIDCIPVAALILAAMAQVSGSLKTKVYLGRLD